MSSDWVIGAFCSCGNFKLTLESVKLLGQTTHRHLVTPWDIATSDKHKIGISRIHTQSCTAGNSCTAISERSNHPRTRELTLIRSEDSTQAIRETLHSQFPQSQFLRPGVRNTMQTQSADTFFFRRPPGSTSAGGPTAARKRARGLSCRSKARNARGAGRRTSGPPRTRRRRPSAGSRARTPRGWARTFHRRLALVRAPAGRI